MRKETIKLFDRSEYTFPVKGKFIPTLTSYIHDENENERPAIIIVPGGCYRAVSATEGEIVAEEFYDKGYNSFVITYTTNLLMDIPLEFQPMKDLSRAVVLVRSIEDYHVRKKSIAICGFSAGGHLTASLGVHFADEVLVEHGKYAGISNRPDAIILCYPVISMIGEYVHRESVETLLGKKPSDAMLDYMSPDRHVTKYTPPAFIWHTVTDSGVPVENSALFARACRSNGVPFEYHVFGNGDHGMSVGNTKLADGEFNGFYTMEQTFEDLQYQVDNGIPLISPFDVLGNLHEGIKIRELPREEIMKTVPRGVADEEIALWPVLADLWLKKVLPA